MEIPAATFWWVAAGVAVAAELGTGTFYLLMIALGLAAAAVAAQSASRCRRRWSPARSSAAARRRLALGSRAGAAREPAAQQNRDVNLDIGERVHVAGLDRRRHRARPLPRLRLDGAARARRAGRARRARRHRGRRQLARAAAASSSVRHLATRDRPWKSRIVLAVIAAIFIFQTFKIVPAAERLGRRAPRQVRPHADAGPEVRRSVHRARRLQALAEGGAARRAEPGLHHARQHPAPGRRDHLLPGDRSDAGELRLEQLHLRDHAARADAAALGDRQDGARPDVRGARPHQPLGRRGARRGRARTGASRCCATRSRT